MKTAPHPQSLEKGNGLKTIRRVLGQRVIGVIYYPSTTKSGYVNAPLRLLLAMPKRGDAGFYIGFWRLKATKPL